MLDANKKELLKIMLLSLIPDIKLDQACTDITGVYYLSGLGERNPKLDILAFKVLGEILTENPSLKAKSLLELIYISEYFDIKIEDMLYKYTWVAEEETLLEIIRKDATSLDSKDWYNDRYLSLLLWISSGPSLGEIDDEFKLYTKVYQENIEPSLVPYNKDDETEYTSELGFRLGGLQSEQDNLIITKVRYLMNKQNLKAFINVNDGAVYFVKPEDEQEFNSSHVDRMWEFK